MNVWMDGWTDICLRNDPNVAFPAPLRALASGHVTNTLDLFVRIVIKTTKKTKYWTLKKCLCGACLCLWDNSFLPI